MVFDSTVQALDIRVLPPEEGDDVCTLLVMVGTILPFALEPGKPLPIPLGVLRFPLNSENANNLAESLKTEAEKLPKPSNIEVASSLAGVEKAVDFTQKLRGD